MKSAAGNCGSRQESGFSGLMRKKGDYEKEKVW